MSMNHLRDLIDAVAYLRMSSDMQALSPEQQRREIQEYADRNGYRILRWYCDEGLSASRGKEGDERRVAYQQLLIDSNAREWEAVLCWSTARFTRNHPHEAAQGKVILRANGVRLVTIKEGVIDWNTFEGVLKDTLFNLLDHKYSVDLSLESLRGRRDTFLRGGYPYGQVPYGYCHLYVNGTERREVPRGTKTKNLRGVLHTLAVVDAEAAVVRRIFDLYVCHDSSLRAIARVLNSEGIPGPGPGVDAEWTVQNVRCRLACPAYAGISVIGKPQRKKPTHTQLAPEERQGDWPPLVARPLWERAQEKLQANQLESTGQGKQKRRKGPGGAQEGEQKRSGALCGVLRCGVCGRMLHKDASSGSLATGRGDRYRCVSPTKAIQTPCHRWGVYEDDIMPRLARELVRAVDEETLRLCQAQPEEAGKIRNGDVLRAHITSLEKRVAEAAHAFTDPDVTLTMKRALQAQVEELDGQITEARQRLSSVEAAEGRGGVQRFLDWWETVRPELLILCEEGVVPVEADQVLQPEGTGDTYLVAQGGEHLVGVRVDVEGDKVVASRGDAIITDPGKVRALLKWLGCEVRVYWKPFEVPPGVKRRRGAGGQQWMLDYARLTITLNCDDGAVRGSSSGRNATTRRRTTNRVERTLCF